MISSYFQFAFQLPSLQLFSHSSPSFHLFFLRLIPDREHRHVSRAILSSANRHRPRSCSCRNITLEIALSVWPRRGIDRRVDLVPLSLSSYSWLHVPFLRRGGSCPISLLEIPLDLASGTSRAQWQWWSTWKSILITRLFTDPDWFPIERCWEWSEVETVLARLNMEFFLF